jgi:putative transposase
VTVVTLTVFEDFAYAAMRKAERIGRPIGSADWIADMEAKTGYKLAPAKRGRKAASDDNE